LPYPEFIGGGLADWVDTGARPPVSALQDLCDTGLPIRSFTGEPSIGNANVQVAGMGGITVAIVFTNRDGCWLCGAGNRSAVAAGTTPVQISPPS
jgi:hypothetical protein